MRGILWTVLLMIVIAAVAVALLIQHTEVGSDVLDLVVERVVSGDSDKEVAPGQQTTKSSSTAEKKPQSSKYSINPGPTAKTQDQFIAEVIEPWLNKAWMVEGVVGVDLDKWTALTTASIDYQCGKPDRVTEADIHKLALDLKSEVGVNLCSELPGRQRAWVRPCKKNKSYGMR